MRARPATPNEERYLNAEAAGPPHYHIPHILRIDGPLDLARFRRALNAVIASQPSLRCRFDRDSEGRWHRQPAPPPADPLVEMAVPGAGIDELRRIVEDRALAPVDYTPATLQYYWLFETGPDRRWFGFSQHHAIADGMSTAIFSAELAEAYRSDAPRPQRGEPGDFLPADWRAAPDLAADLAFWRQRLMDVAAPTSYLQDLGSSPADDDLAAPSAYLYVMAAAEERRELKAAAAEFGVSEFNLLATAVAVMAARASGGPDVLASFQSNGRHRIAGADTVLGSFSNAILLPVTVDETQSARMLVAAVKADLRDGLAHQFAPFHEVMRHTGRRARLGINMFPLLPTLELPGLEVGPVEILGRHFDFELNFRFVSRGEALEIILYYRGSIVSEAMARLTMRRVVDLALAMGAAPDAPLSAIEAPDAPEAPPADVADVRAIHADFLAIAARTPDRTAIISDAGAMRYGDLAAASTALARAVASHVAPGQTVAIAADRGPCLVVAMLAALQAGTPFAVFDAGYGEERWQIMAEMIRPALVIDALPGDAGRARALADLAGATLLAVDDAGPDAQPLPAIDARAAAYMLFTSGTTGRPRCVVNWHGPLVHFLDWQRQAFGITADDRFTMFAGLGHDPLLRDIFAPLSVGASLLIPPQSRFSEPRGLSRWVAQVKPTVVHLTPAVGRLLCEGAASDALASLRLLFWGGDQLLAGQVNAVAALVPAAQQVNVYGSTETPQVIASHELAVPLPAHSRIPIGMPTPGFILDVVAPGGRRCAVAETGEIVVRSPWLGLGMIDRDGSRQPPGNHHATGDLAWRCPDGGLLLRGRNDDQVKLRGYRVRTSDVLAALEQAPGVAAAAVIITGQDGEHQLHAFIVPQGGAASDENALKRRLGAALTPGHVPATITALPALPLLPNGKLDRAALAARIGNGGAAQAPAVAGLAGALLADLSGLLNRRFTDPELSFAMMGGDSLSTVQAQLLLEDRLGEVPQGWEMMSISQLAARGEGQRGWGRRLPISDVLRMLGILAIVAFHYRIARFGGGSTSVLLLVSGLLFGQLQLARSNSLASARPVLQSAIRLSGPVLMFGFIAFVLKTLDGDAPSLLQHLVSAPFTDYRSSLGRSGDSPYTMLLWFGQTLVYILVILWGVLAVAQRRWPGRVDGFQLGLALVLAGAFGRFAVPQLVQLPWWELSPLAHIGSLALGIMIAGANTRARRFVLLAVLLLYVVGIAQVRSVQSGALVAAIGVLLLLGITVRLPTQLARGVQAISSNSLYIYLTHGLVLAALLRLTPMLPGPAMLAIALLFGVGIGQVWRRLEAALTGRQARHSLSPDEA